MVIIMAVADMVEMTRILVNEIRDRKEASAMIDREAHELNMLVGQIGVLVPEIAAGGAGLISPAIKTSLDQTRILLEEVKQFVMDEKIWQESAGCCAKFSGNKNRIETIGKETRNTVAGIIRSAAVNAGAAEGSQENVDALTFWTSSFGDEAREVSWTLFRSALAAKCGLDGIKITELDVLKASLCSGGAGSNTIDSGNLGNQRQNSTVSVSAGGEDVVVKQSTVTSQDSATMNMLANPNFAGNDQVSVFHYAKVFGSSETDTVVETSDKVRATLEEKKRVIRDRKTKEEMEIDAGFVLIPQSGNLSTVRSEIVAATQDDDELPEEAEFLAAEPGKFSFYLDHGKARVKKSQETIINDPNSIDNACIVPDNVAGGALGNVTTTPQPSPGKSKLGQVVPMTPEESARQAGGAGGAAAQLAQSMGPEPEGEEEVAKIDKTAMAVKDVQKESRAEWAQNLSIMDVISDDTLVHTFKAVLGKMGLTEDGVNFLQKRLAMEKSGEADKAAELGAKALAGGEGGVEAMTERWRQRYHGAGISVEQLKRDFLGKDSPLELLITEDTKKTGNEVEAVALDVMKQLGGAPMEHFRKLIVKKPRTKLGKGTRVVVLGGGYGGSSSVAYLREILPEVTIIMIDTKEFYEDTPMILRSMVLKDYWKTNHIMHKDYLGDKNQLILGKCIELHSDHCIVGANRQVVPFDYCINVTGSSYYSDIKTTSTSAAVREQRMVQERQKIAEVEKVLIVGGGVVGCELSSDIKCEFPEKQVRVVHAHDKLLPRMPGAHEHVHKAMTDLGIKVDLNQRVLPYAGEDHFETDAGEMIEAANTRVYWATGYRPNTAHFKAGSFGKKALDQDGFAKVDDNMNILGSDRIFCCGDCVEERHFAQGERMAHYAVMHAALACRNIQRLVEGMKKEELFKFQAPSSNRPILILELGPEKAFVQSPEEYGVLWGMFLGEKTAEETGKLVPAPNQKLNKGMMQGVMNASFIKHYFTQDVLQKLAAGAGAQVSTGAGMLDAELGFCALLATHVDPTGAWPPAPAPEGGADGSGEKKEEEKK